MDEVVALQSAARLRDRERAAFEMIGSLVAAAVDPGLKIRLAETSRHSAWRSEQWAALVAEPLPPAIATVPDGIEHPRVAAPPSSADDAVVVAWLDGVLRELVEATEQVGAHAEAVSGGPWVRVARRVLADLHMDQAS